MFEDNGGVGDAIEHGGFDGGVVVHVFEREYLAGFERCVEVPWSHVVTAEARVTSESVREFAVWVCLRNDGLVRHFESVGHMACEADVDDSSFDALVIDNVDDLGYKVAGAPCPSGTGFENDVEVRVSVFEVLNCFDKSIDVVVLSGHEVSAAHVYPFEEWEVFSELRFESFEDFCEIGGGAFAEGVEVESFDAVGEGWGHIFGADTESGPGERGVVEVGFDYGAVRVDAEPCGDFAVTLEDFWHEALGLAERVECDVCGSVEVFVDCEVGVGGAV